jgi:ATP-binding cassette, subfamily F, member 3
LSGGERGRVGLAAQLVAPADVLLLDEPTNHLDLDTTRWLEDYLASLDATVLLISHDRAFLEAVVDHVLHVENGTITPYTGSYSDFVRQRAERRLTQERAFDAQRKTIAADEDFIRRNIAGQKSRQAKSRRARLARLPRLSPPPSEERAMSLRLEAGARGGDQVMVAEGVRVEVPGRVLLDGFSALVRRGDIIGLVGANGSGKSTLLRAIAGEAAPAAGREGGRVRGGRPLPAGPDTGPGGAEPVRHHPRPEAALGPGQGAGPPRTVRLLRRHRPAEGGDAVGRRAGPGRPGDAHAEPGELPPPGRADQPPRRRVHRGAGGRPRRIRRVRPPGEPRPGAAAGIGTRVWALEDGRIEDFPGDFAEWEERRQDREAARARELAEAQAARRVEDRQRARQRDARSRQDRDALRALRAAVHDAEAEIARIEEQITDLRALLEDPELYADAAGVQRSVELTRELQDAETELEHAIQHWTNATDALELAQNGD